MSVSRAAFMSLGGLLVLTACAVPAPSEVDLFETAVMDTVEALASLPPMTSTATPSRTPAPTPTSTLAPTTTLTPTPLPPMASVSQATNCRTGPGSAYPFVLSIQPERVVEVTAKSSVDDYWYITNPDQADENCWLWGEYATVEGDVSTLPVLTPEPTPVPKIDFILYQNSFMSCGSLHVSFTVINNSRTTFKTAKIHVQDLNYPDDIHGPAVDRHPFAPSPSFCPPGHSNFFPPGAVAYLVVPISPVRAGNDALATIKLCTEDWGGGDCVAKLAYFKLPGN
ncbi:MAG: hypothetical protein ACC647_06975 [Anaerolineales bacterium]